MNEKRMVVNDCFVDVMGRRPSDYELDIFCSAIPESIESLAEEWGWFDTEVREQVYRFIQESNVDA